MDLNQQLTTRLDNMLMQYPTSYPQQPPAPEKPLHCTCLAEKPLLHILAKYTVH